MMGNKARDFFQQERASNHKANWVIMESCDLDHDHDHDEDASCNSSFDEQENSISSQCSSSSSDLTEDANSSKSSSTSSISTLSNGPLYELSELMLQLPLRRGLSKYYQGKSESFTSLASVKSSEDLRKKVTPLRKRFIGCLDSHKLHSPKAVISKKSTRASSFSPFGNFRPSLPIKKYC